MGVVVAPRLAEEDQDEPAHGVHGGQDRHQKGPQVEAKAPEGVGEGGGEDGVLGPEAGEEGKPTQGQGPDQAVPAGQGQVLPEAAHLAHVLLPAQGVNHAPRGQEEEGLEEGVGEDVEEGHPVGPHPRR